MKSGNIARVSFRFDDRGWIKSVKEFIESLFDLRRTISNSKLWYRGQSDTQYKLQPTVGRKHRYIGKEVTFTLEQEKQLLHRFRRRIYPHTDRTLNAGEAMFIARHYGLPTRLLDWTANALFGLYFACSGQHERPATLWAIQKFEDSSDLDVFDIAKKENEDDLLTMYPNGDKGVNRKNTTEDAVKIVHPLYNSPRIIAQDGAFTLHSNPWKTLDSYQNASFLPNNLDISALYCWRIRSKNKRRFIEELSGLGFTHRTVFPDLDGIAKSLWETELIWHGKYQPHLKS